MAENYIDIIKRQNPGILIEEKDYSIYNITQHYNKVNLVIGSSKTGPINLPVLLVSPENTEEIFGKRDKSMERKGSYFHKTINTMLESGPVIAVNIRQTDKNLDFYNWQNISFSSDNHNSKKRSNPVDEFYNTSNGFWKRSKEQLLDIVKSNIPDQDKKPFTIVNYGQKPVSILFTKSVVSGFDIPFEDWYNGSVPDYLHPKEFVSEYMVDVTAVEGDWYNYNELSNNPRWSKYFHRTGFKKSKLREFLNDPEVKTIGQWTGSIIPYFNDKSKRDIYIESVINDDINESGILVSVNTDVIEQDFRSCNIDMSGENLIKNKIPKIDFLSYKRYLTDFLCVSEKTIDNPGNSFGDYRIDFSGRRHLYTEGYIHNAKLKPLIISSTTSLYVKPIDASNDAYMIVNGTLVELTSDIEDTIALHEVVSPGNKIPYVIIATETGIVFKIGQQVKITDTLLLPEIDWKTQYVLGYHIIKQDINFNFSTDLVSVVLDSVGYINPFLSSSDLDLGTTVPKIVSYNDGYLWQNKIVFESIHRLDTRNYNQGIIYHMWYWLSNHLAENESIAIDTNGHKQTIQYIEQGFDDNTNDKWIKISAHNRGSDITLNNGTNGMGYVCLYIGDNEFLAQSETRWREQQETYAETEGIYGVIGAESEILTAYYDGQINSGDPFFWGLSDEYDIEFLYDSISRQNLIVFKDGQIYEYDYSNRTIVMKGTEYNDGIFTTLQPNDYNGYFAISVQEEVVPEIKDVVSIFDAEQPFIMNLYFSNKKLQAQIESFDGKPIELYTRLFEKDQNSQFSKTLEVEQILESNKILVDSDRYLDIVKKGYFIMAKQNKYNNRNWTRIIDVVRYHSDPNLLLIETDYAIAMKDFETDIQTEMYIPIYDWIDTLDFKVLEPHIPRSETMPDGTESRLQEILDTIAPRTKLAKALTTEQMDWRYLVDSYGLGLVENSKHQLGNLVDRKMTALAFINAPSVKDFKNSSNTKYTTNNIFDTTKLLNGGERQTSEGIRYSFTDIGQSNSIYCFPYVAVTEDNRFRLEPPAVHIAKQYMTKFNDNTEKNPWSIMAGIIDGRLRSIVGLEETFTIDELNDLNQYGFTSIANSYRNNIFYIYNENTSVPSNIGSSLRFIHIREVMIELESDMLVGLEEFKWTEYTETNTKNVLKKANDICDYYQRSGAIYNYSNDIYTDNKLKDAQILVLNTYIEPVQGMGTIILRVSVTKTGQVQSISEQI